MRENEKILADFLDTALDIEEEISRGIYQHYLVYDNWPKGFAIEYFKEVKSILEKMIEDTKNHEEKFHKLKRSLSYGQAGN